MENTRTLAALLAGCILGAIIMVAPPLPLVYAEGGGDTIICNCFFCPTGIDNCYQEELPEENCNCFEGDCASLIIAHCSCPLYTYEVDCAEIGCSECDIN